MDVEGLKHILFAAAALALAVGELLYVRLPARLHATPVGEAPGLWKRAAVLALALMILLSCWAMSLNPLWNGEKPQYRDQYEHLAESFLAGKLYLDYGPVDPALLALDNPYDPDARAAAGAAYHWDHAFYNGQYYMYFGVVPVLLLFLPFRALTGLSLTTYHATQIFIAGFFCGMFLLFRLMARRWCRSMSFGAWLLLFITCSLSSVWNCIACPALYNTAVSSALCMMIWSVYFYVRAVLDTEEPVPALRLAFVGAIFGALAFGCRPPIALGNLLALPLLVVFLKKHRLNARLALRLLAVLLPYALVAAGLMWYNKARFGNPFEFGQSYQLTVADQSQYGSRSPFFLHWTAAVNAVIFNFFRSPELSYEYPCFGTGGIFLVYPVFCYCFLAAGDAAVLRRLRDYGLSGLALGLALCPLVITLIDSIWAPFLTESYRQDLLWLVGILSFLLIGLRFASQEDRARSSRWVCRWCLWSLAVGFLLFSKLLLLTE